MKKSFFLGLLCMLFLVPLSAEEYDLLITADRNQIRCTILEISDVSIRYTRADRPQSITFSTPISQIHAIVYRDGTIEQLSASNATATTDTVPAAAPVVSSPTKHPLPHAAAAATPTHKPARDTKTDKAANSSEQLPGHIYCDRRLYVHNDHYISEKEVVRILQTDAIAYDSWQRAQRMAVGSIVTTSIGGGLAIIGLCCLPASIGAGLGVAGGGLAMLCVGTGLICGAIVRQERAINLYNDHVDARLQVSLFASPCDIGFAIRF